MVMPRLNATPHNACVASQYRGNILTEPNRNHNFATANRTIAVTPIATRICVRESGSNSGGGESVTLLICDFYKHVPEVEKLKR